MGLPMGSGKGLWVLGDQPGRGCPDSHSAVWSQARQREEMEEKDWFALYLLLCILVLVV